jgi:hypothetical protein
MPKQSANRDTPSPSDYQAKLCGVRKWVNNKGDGQDVQCPQLAISNGGYCLGCLKFYKKSGFWRNGDVRVTGEDSVPNQRDEGKSLENFLTTHPMANPAGEFNDRRSDGIKRLFPLVHGHWDYNFPGKKNGTYVDESPAPFHDAPTDKQEFIQWIDAKLTSMGEQGIDEDALEQPRRPPVKKRSSKKKVIKRHYENTEKFGCPDNMWWEFFTDYDCEGIDSDDKPMDTSWVRNNLLDTIDKATHEDLAYSIWMGTGGTSGKRGGVDGISCVDPPASLAEAEKVGMKYQVADFTERFENWAWADYEGSADHERDEPELFQKGGIYDECSESDSDDEGRDWAAAGGDLVV